MSHLSNRKSQPAPAQERTLADLKPGQRARVVGFAESNPLAQRIMQLGLIAGAMLTFVRAAPAGDPIEINVFGYSLSLRKSEARMILVEDVA
ncbi:MAG: ferrous iron transport protein A [Chromatiales bacterium]